MPLPTMSLRASPEYHQLIRDIATALRTRPELEAALRDVLQSQHNGEDRIAFSNTDVLPLIYERLESNAQASARVMAFAENINERVKALEQPEALRNTEGNTSVLQSILERIAALEERVIAAGAPSQPAKARSRGRARDAKISPPG